MAEVKWIKITVSMFDDEKIDFIESLPECDAILVIWVKMLALAGKCNTGGFLLLTPTIPYNEDMLSHKFKRPLSTIRFALKTFIQLGMVEIGEMGYFISNWEKHQNSEKLELIREHNRIAKQRQRNKQKLLSQGTVPDNVQDGQRENPGQSGRCHDTEVERDKEVEKEYTSSSTTDEPEYIKLLDYYLEKCFLNMETPMDIQTSKRLTEDQKIPLSICLQGIDEKLLKRKPKHDQDKIRSLSYFEGKIKDLWEVEKARTVSNDGSTKGSVGKSEYDGIGITAEQILRGSV